MKNFAQGIIALSKFFENVRYDLASYLFSGDRRVHRTLDVGPATWPRGGVVRILKTEDCHFVIRARRAGSCATKDYAATIRPPGRLFGTSRGGGWRATLSAGSR